MLKIAILTTDNREHQRSYAEKHPRFGTAPEALIQGFSRTGGLEIHVVSCTQKTLDSPSKLAENVFFHSLLVPKFGWLRSGYQGCIRAVRRKLREIQPDIVHGQGTERDCAISAVFSGFPNVLTIHGNMRLVAEVNHARPFSFDWLAARLESFTLPRSDGVVCITGYTREAVKDLARKTWLLPNAVDASFFEIENKPAIPLQVLCVGNICQLKNQNALIRSLDGLNPDFELVFLGALHAGNAYGAEFSKLIASRPWCRYDGFVDRAGLKERLSRASGLILPSLEDNCPMVVLEAMAARVPVAAAAVGGVPDLIEDGVTGFLFDPLDARSIFRAVEGLTGPSSRSMAVEARGRALLRFHPEVIARRHVEIYREVLEGG